MVNKVLKLILLFSPIAYTSGVKLNTFDIDFFKIATIGLFMASLLDKPKREIDRSIVYVIVSLLILCFIGLYRYTFSNIVYLSFINLSFAMFALSIIIRYVDNIEQFYKYIILAAAINIAVFTLQRFDIFLIFNSDIKAGFEGGLIGNGPRLTSYLCIVLPILLNQSILWLIPLLAISFIMKEYAILPILPIVLFFKVNRILSRNLSISIIVLSTIVLITLFHNPILSSLKIRWLTWEPTIKLIMKYPSMGYGLGTFPMLSQNFTRWIDKDVWIHSAYNSYLQFVFGIGLLGVAWIIYTLNLLKRMFIKSPEAIAVLGLTVLALYEYPIEIPRLWFTIISLIGFMIIRYINRQGSKNVVMVFQ